MEHTNNNLEKNIETTIKKAWVLLKKSFERIDKYLWFNWWIIIWLIIIIVLLVFHYQNKIDTIQSNSYFYYERPVRVWYNRNDFDGFDYYFNKQNRYFNRLFEQQEKFIKKYWDLFDSNKWIVDTSKESRQTYEKYYLYDWNVYSYKIDYNNWIVNWNLMINDTKKKEYITRKLQELWLKFSDSDIDINFSWNMDNINSLLNILN